jgi:hypothetical protein
MCRLHLISTHALDCCFIPLHRVLTVSLRLPLKIPCEPQIQIAVLEQVGASARAQETWEQMKRWLFYSSIVFLISSTSLKRYKDKKGDCPRVLRVKESH